MLNIWVYLIVILFNRHYFESSLLRLENPTKEMTSQVIRESREPDLCKNTISKPSRE
ncbi:hypothetical protein THOG05_180092 [Vibrio rotiferianus]|nr:hypothetical protein THOG05_180092 [Vibrio rotiferianus]CAH1555511.1 hypothetical protein THOE12_150109 [Vibrio rotiferianus]CAH1572311.1 hypothetical protein THOG10_200012 [Vibrio rotiferianus]CAH1574962.1 hypothetical protein THOB06_200089 [Vibrio rotiferianus]